MEKVYIDIDDKKIKGLIDESKKFFEHVDVDYFDKLKELFSKTVEELRRKGLLKQYKKYSYRELEDSMAIGKGIWGMISVPERRYTKPANTPQKTFQIIENFFYTLGEKYGDLAHNQLKKSNVALTDRALKDEDYIHRFMSIEDNVLLEDASNFLLVLEGNYLDVIVDAHEITHKITDFFGKGDIDSSSKDGKKEINRIKKSYSPNFINEVGLCEATAMYAELLCADYIAEKYGNREYEKWAMTIKGRSLVEALDDKSESIKLEDISQWLRLIKSIDGKSDEDIFKVRAYFNEHPSFKFYTRDPKVFPTILVSTVDHVMGYYYAVYLKNLCDKNPSRKVQMYEDCLQINCYGENCFEEQAELIEKIGLPMIRDGKIVMDDEAIEELSSVWVDYFSRMKSIKPKETTSIVEVVKSKLDGGISTVDVINACDARESTKDEKGPVK